MEVGRLLRKEKLAASVGRTAPDGCDRDKLYDDACKALKHDGVTADLNDTVTMCNSAAIIAMASKQADQRIDAYLREMGVDHALLTEANAIPHQSLRFLRRDEIVTAGRCLHSMDWASTGPWSRTGAAHEIERTEVTGNLDFEADGRDGELMSALNAAYIQLLQFVHDRDLRLADRDVDAGAKGSSGVLEKDRRIMRRCTLQALPRVRERLVRQRTGIIRAQVGRVGSSPTSCFIAADGSLSPESFRTSRMLLTEELGQVRTLRSRSQRDHLLP
jgi:hypothetical protein